MQQKIIQVGNSLAITLPAKFVREQKLKAGQEVFVEADSDLDVVQVKTTSNAKASLTPEFKTWLDGFVDRYENSLEELAKR